METVLIILAIIWVIVPLAAKKKQQQAKEEAERQRAARQRAPLPVVPQRAPQQPVRTVPLAPTTRPAMAPSSYEGVGSTEGTSVGAFEGEPTHDVSSQLSQVSSTLTEAKVSITHGVTPSNESGHAHEETSMSGLDSSCPPNQAPTDPFAQTASSNGYTAFVWNVEQARSGLVMAEILGPCLANRD